MTLFGFQLDIFAASQRAENLEKTILSRKFVFSLFVKANGRSCHSQAKKYKQCSKNMQRLENCVLQGLEWHRLNVRRTQAVQNA